MSADKSKATSSGTDYRIKAGSGWDGAWKISAAVGALGLIGTAVLARGDMHRFAFSYLFAVFVCLTIAMGSLFFVVVQYLTKAWWSVSVRRTAEFFMMGIPAVVILMIPLLFRPTLDQLFPWIEGSPAAQRMHEKPGQSEHSEKGPKELTVPHGPSHAKPEAEPAKAEHSELEPVNNDTDESWHIRSVVAQAAPPPAPRGPHAAPAPHAGPPMGIPGHPPMGGMSGPMGAPPPGGGHPPRPMGPPHGGNDQAKHALEAAEENDEAALLNGKRAYLNLPFFWIRQILYSVIWIFIAWRYFSWSTEQDTTKKVENTSLAQRAAPAALILFGLTLTFASFDWLMSLDPMWYSTIFGVCIFAGSVVSSLAVLILASLALNRSGLLGTAVSVEHYHDLGKLMFGFLVFWAYVTFSQFFLIWYSNIPEEVAFFHMRWTDNDGTWKTFAWAIVIGHFAVPFWLIMSRNVKRRPFWLGLGAFIILVMHVIEIYWLILPNIGPFAINALDATSLVGCCGVYFAAILFRMRQHPLIPVGDPRLARALKFENA